MLFLLFFCILVRVSAIFEDQIGLHDWKIRNIGLDIRETLFSSKGLVVASGRGILGSVDTTNGNFHWRLQLESPIDAMSGSADGSIIYTLSHEGRVARAWSATRGSMLWECPLTTGMNATHAITKQTLLSADKRDVAVSPDGENVFVMAHNTFSVLSTRNGGIKAQWYDKAITLSNFVVPSASLTKEQISDIKTARVAVGCKSTGGLPGAHCDRAIVLEMSIEDLSLSATTVTHSRVNLLPLSVRGVMPYSALEIFGPGDFLLGENSKKADTISMLVLASGSTIDAPVPGKLLDAKASIAIMRHDITSAVVSYCSPSLDSNNMYLQSCKSLTLDPTEKTFAPLESCSGVAAAISYGYAITSSQLVNAVTCTVFNGTDLQHTTVMNPKGSDTVTHATPVGKLGDDTFIQGFRLVRSHVFSGPGKTVQTRVLAMSSSGTFFLAVDGDVVWRKEESLSAVLATIVVDHTETPAKTTSATTHVPNLEERLRMQYYEIQSYVFSLMEYLIIAAPSAVLNTVTSPNAAYDYIFKKSAVTRTREERDREAVSFGLDKVAVAATSASGVTNLLHAGIKVVGINQVQGEVQWTFEPRMSDFVEFFPIEAIYPMNSYHPLQFNVKLLRMHTMATSNKPAAVAALVSIQVGNEAVTLVYTLDPHTGQSTSETSGPVITIPKYVDEVFAAPKPLSTSNDHAYILCTDAHDEVILLNPQTSVSASTQPIYYHTLADGLMESRRLLANCSTSSGVSICSSVQVGSAVFSPQQERLVASASPPLDDTLYSKVVVMGDDSLLLKYINPHLRVVVTIRRAVSDEDFTLLTVNAIDTVSAKIVYRSIIEDAQEPVYASIVENNFIVSYWNSKAKRAELSSVSLYEGMIDKHGLGPYGFSNGKHARLAEAANQPFSSFSHGLPIAMNKTFIVSKVVVGLGHTLTARGIANKQFIAALGNGQIFTLDRRMIDPRRPVNPPLQREKQEGLMQYSPFLFLSPSNSITFNETIATTHPINFHAAPSNLESTGSILVTGLDVYFVRVKPSQEFDLLASDFNHPLLVLILGGMVIGLWYLREMSRAKALGSAWK